MPVYLEDYVPVVKYEGLNTNKAVDFTGTFKLNGTAVTATAAELNLLDGIPTADPEDSSTIWNDGGVLKVATAG